LSKKEFLKRAEAACEKQRESLVEEASNFINKRIGKGDTEADELALIGPMAKAVMVPTIEAEIAAVRKLGAPAGDEEQIEALLEAQQEAVEEVKELKSANSLEDVEKHFANATEMYAEYGFGACTNSPASR
jgi:hypothetical protein